MWSKGFNFCAQVSSPGTWVDNSHLKGHCACEAKGQRRLVLGRGSVERAVSCAWRGSAQSVPRQADDLFSLPDSRSSSGGTIKLLGSSNRLIGCGDGGAGRNLRLSGKREQCVLSPAGRGPYGGAPSSCE